MNDFRYVEEKCPVCGECFREGDDIVVCPLCGTPHHRECYRKNGECGNSEKHSDGFIWSAEAKEDENSSSAEVQTEEPQNVQMPPFSQGMPTSPFVQLQDPLGGFPPEFSDGVSTLDAAMYIKFNVPNYLRKFFTEKAGKRTFNIAAFFFGGYWFIYRKMYKLGAIFLTLTLLLTTIPMFIPQYTRLNREMEEIRQKYQNSTALDTDAAPLDTANAIYADMSNAIKKHPAGLYVEIAVYAAEIALSIYMGFIANKKYMAHIEEKIRQINSTAQTEELKKWRLADGGGKSMGLAFLSGFLIYALQTGAALLSQIIIK